MTAAQKTAKDKFKKAIAYRQKTGVSLKEAFAHIYGKKKTAAVKKRVGALPVGFKGSIYDIGFKIVNQYDIYNDVSAIMEDTNTGNRIVTFDGKGSPKDKAEAIVSYISKATNIQGGYRDDKQLYSRMLKFATNMQKEVKDFNAGKKKTIKKEPLKILAPKNIVTTKKRLPSVIKLINKTIDKVYKKSKAKKSAPKKKVAKKIVRKVVKKKAAPKKVAKKKLTSRDYDIRYQALRPGKRVAYETGNVYYESRPNRSDRGKLLGIGNVLNKNQEIKRLSQLAKTPLEKRIVSMIKYKLTGYDNLESLLKDILYNGLQSGIVSDLIYYSDTLAFYKRYKKEIDTLLKDLVNETGSNSPADLFGNKWDKEDFFIEDTNNRNLLAWFGFEEKLRQLADKLGYEI